MFESTSGVSILLVDDQIENLVALQAVLSDLGQNIVTATSGRQALRCLLQEEIAVIVLDINMPDMCGFETAKFIRMRAATKNIPIIFLTATSTEDAHAARAYSLGAVDFITKPIKPEFLKSKISVFVELAKKTVELRHQAELKHQIECQRAAEERERLEADKRDMQDALLLQNVQRELIEERSRQVEKADRLKSEFLANMSHEIRTPMNGVVGMADLLMQTPLNAQQKEFSKIILDSASALLMIINDILDLSKIESGKVSLEIAPFDPVTLVEGTLQILLDSFRKKNISIMTYVQPEVPAVLMGDAGRLRQVLLNLTNNAFKFTEKGEVVVSVQMVESGISNRAASDDTLKLATFDRLAELARRKCAWLEFSITDTGMGLSSVDQTRLFKPFSQADSSSTRKYGGTGLGLSISKCLIELMGGSIGVESEVGVGSRFWFRVPFEIITASNDRRKIPGDLSKMRVLIVDDRASAREILSKYLSAWSIKHDAVANDTEALSMFRHAAQAGAPYNLAISELNIGGMDIFELTEMVSKDKLVDDLRVILCTSSSEPGLGSRARQLGVSAFLAKPVQQSKLFNCIATLFGPQYMAGPTVDRRIKTTWKDFQARRKVLIAEDNAVNRQVAILQMKKLGLEPRCVSNGKIALSEALNGGYAMIVMDCEMPEMDGFTATKEIRKNEALTGEHVPIVGLTAHAMEGSRELCIASGMDDYLTKPAPLDKIQRMLEKWLPDLSAENNSQNMQAEDREALTSARQEESSSLFDAPSI